MKILTLMVLFMSCTNHIPKVENDCTRSYTPEMIKELEKEGLGSIIYDLCRDPESQIYFTEQCPEGCE